MPAGSYFLFHPGPQTARFNKRFTTTRGIRFARYAVMSNFCLIIHYYNKTKNMKPFNCLLLLVIITFSSYQLKNNNQKLKEYFSIPAVTYNKITYQLSWSAHPADNYYKQEYLPAGEKPETYSHMIMIEAVTGDISLKDAVGAKINELEQRKKNDPVANYQVIENKTTGEYLLDFVISESPGNAAAVTEWNTYRYLKLKDKSGKKGIQLFACSKRGYGAGTTNFLQHLKTERQKDISIFAAYKIPEVTIKAQ